MWTLDTVHNRNDIKYQNHIHNHAASYIASPLNNHLQAPLLVEGVGGVGRVGEKALQGHTGDCDYFYSVL